MAYTHTIPPQEPTTYTTKFTVGDEFLSNYSGNTRKIIDIRMDPKSGPQYNLGDKYNPNWWSTDTFEDSDGGPDEWWVLIGGPSYRPKLTVEKVWDFTGEDPFTKPPYVSCLVLEFDEKIYLGLAIKSINTEFPVLIKLSNGKYAVARQKVPVSVGDLFQVSDAAWKYMEEHS